MSVEGDLLGHEEQLVAELAALKNEQDCRKKQLQARLAKEATLSTLLELANGRADAAQARALLQAERVACHQSRKARQDAFAQCEYKQPPFAERRCEQEARLAREKARLQEQKANA